jgi:Tfp pilus assembly protein PilX
MEWRQVLHHDGARLGGGAVSARLRERLAREESGFTLIEALVTMMMMILVLFALYSIFDMSLRVFSFGNDKTEAVENARVGLERMEREIRAAYPYNKAAGNTTILADGTASEVTFGNDLDGNRKIECPNANNECEIVTYRRGISDPNTVQRENGGQTQPVVNYVNGLSFEYLDAAGNPTAYSSAQRVRIKLDVSVQRGPQAGTQTLTTDVALRNRRD